MYSSLCAMGGALKQFPHRIRIIEKGTMRTWIAYPCNHPHFAPYLIVATGEKRIIAPGRCGWSEYNDRGSPVLDSFICEPCMFYGKIINAT